MPSLEEHLRADRELLGREFPEVHEILDQFAHYPDMRFLSVHRRYLHHKEGVGYIALRFGQDAGLAASQHVIDDCGWVPNAKDYYNGVVDNFGQRR